jgi:hypothetical protein
MSFVNPSPGLATYVASRAQGRAVTARPASSVHLRPRVVRMLAAALPPLLTKRLPVDNMHDG